MEGKHVPHLLWYLEVGLLALIRLYLFVLAGALGKSSERRFYVLSPCIAATTQIQDVVMRMDHRLHERCEMVWNNRRFIDFRQWLFGNVQTAHGTMVGGSIVRFPPLENIAHAVVLFGRRVVWKDVIKVPTTSEGIGSFVKLMMKDAEHGHVQLQGR